MSKANEIREEKAKELAGMKKVTDLKRGDIIIVDGIEFVVAAVANLPDGRTTLLFRDMPATLENLAAYGELLRIMKEWKEKENEREEVHGPTSD